MKSKRMKKLGKQGILFLSLVCLGLPLGTIQAVPVQTTPGQELMMVLRTCLFLEKSKDGDFNDKTPFNQFVAKMLKFLEDANCATAIKKEYPNLNIPGLIAALKKVQFKTSAMLIGFTLKSFFKELPQDLQNISALLTGLNKRLAIK